MPSPTTVLASLENQMARELDRVSTLRTESTLSEKGSKPKSGKQPTTKDAA